MDLGHGIIDIQTNSKQELWVSYSDNGIYGANNGDSKDFIEKMGLNCFDVNGNILYRYNSSPHIDSCDGLNVYSDNEILINMYSGSVESWFALAKISNKKAEKILEWREHTNYLASSENMVLIENRDGICDDIKSKFTFVDIKSFIKEEIIYEFFSENNERLHCVHAQKDNLYFW